MQRKIVVGVGVAAVVLFAGIVALRVGGGDSRKGSASAGSSENRRLDSPSPVSPSGSHRSEASSPAPHDDRPTAITRESVPAVFRRLLEWHKADARRVEGDDRTGHDGGMGRDLLSGFAQGRLLALCEPDESERLALDILKNPQADRQDVLYAIRILGVLAALGRGAAETALIGLTRGEDPVIVPLALEGLFAYDKTGRNRSFYWAACTSGPREAFGCGPYWPDAQTRQFLENRRDRFAAEKRADYRSKESLERMAILESSERSKALEDLLAGPNVNAPPAPGWSQPRESWALNVVQKDPPPGILDAFRKRLDRGELAVVKTRLEGAQIDPTHPGYCMATRDPFFDEVLVAFLSLGGKPNELETKRLTYYGYLGDPRARLQALLESHK